VTLFFLLGVLVPFFFFFLLRRHDDANASTRNSSQKFRVTVVEACSTGHRVFGVADHDGF
jgi:hypothetical protein